MSESTGQNVQLRVVWGDVSQLAVLAANQFALQVSGLGGVPDEVVLTVGHVAAPVLTGSPEEQRANISELSHVEVHPLARFSMSLGKLDELATAISEIRAHLGASRVAES